MTMPGMECDTVACPVCEAPMRRVIVNGKTFSESEKIGGSFAGLCLDCAEEAELEWQGYLKWCAERGYQSGDGRAA